MKKVAISMLFMLFFLPLTAHAYIGPGLGTGIIGVVLGILTAFFLAITAIIWYPLKRLYKQIFKGKGKTTGGSETIDSL
jgi:hypothetical protein